MSACTDYNSKFDRYWYPALALLFLLGLYLRWPYPTPGWIHIDERVFLLNPLKLWSGDLNPHFFIYPTLHIYLTAALYYGYYWLGPHLPIEHFVAYQYFVDGSELIAVTRHFNTLLSTITAVVIALAGRRLYGVIPGLVAGFFFAVLPLSVRFAHLATTDSPAVLWIACTLVFAIRIAQKGEIGDAIWAGVFVGLAGATKYPAALAGVPVAVACFLYRPTWRQREMWAAGVMSIVVFVLTSPYVILDVQHAWRDLALMGKVHLGSVEAKANMPSWRYYFQYGLRYGIGWLGLLGLAIGLAWQPLQRRREEWVVVASFVIFFSLLMVTESAFMRYALPLSPSIVLLWIRPLLSWRPIATGLLALALIAEPLYASWQTRSLLAGDDTREQVERMLAKEIPAGAWLIHIPPFAGNIRVVHPGLVFSHEQRYLLSYRREDLIAAYGMLSQRSDLPPLYISLSPLALNAQSVAEASQADGQVYVLKYEHPAIRLLTADESAFLEKEVDWIGEYVGSGAGAVYEAIDWYFVPIGNFTSEDLTGPKIRVGKVPIKAATPGLDSAVFFGVLYGILLGAEKVEAEDWTAVLELYDAIGQTPLPLHHILSSDYFYTYLFNYGIAHEKLGRPGQATHMWELALEVKDDSAVLHQNLGVAYARQGRLSEALGHLRQALQLDGDYEEAHYNLGNVQYQQGEISAAMASWFRVVELDERHAGAWQGLGNVHYHKQDWPQAIDAYKRALILVPEDASLLFNMAQVYLKQADYDSAIAALQQGIALQPGDGEIHFTLAMAYERVGQGKLARKSMKDALKLDVNHPRAEQIRAYLGRRP